MQIIPPFRTIKLDLFPASHMYILSVYTEKFMAAKAKVFKSGNSQAVRLPKEFRFETEEVEIFRRDDEIVLRKPHHDLVDLAEVLSDLSEDFLEEGRKQPKAQKRKSL